ncbi:MAG TPA: hypothetical protein VMT89_03695 [Candidatus Acidoferrales bacterium]|nr:hypothetical protein [Candidatus Acidoferrales bacterium]
MSWPLRVASLALTVVALVVLLRAPAPQPATPENIQAVFRTYKDAVLKGDGAAAAAVLSQDTVDWYAESQQLALHGTKDQLQKLQPLQRFQALAFRYRTDPHVLRTLSPRQVIAYAVEQGWMGKSTLERTDIGDVKIAGDTAEAEVTVDGKPAGQQYNFMREQGQWRFDQLPLLASGDEQLRAAAAQRKMSEEQLILALLEAFSKKKVGDEIWVPPGDKN